MSGLSHQMGETQEYVSTLNCQSLVEGSSKRIFFPSNFDQSDLLLPATKELKAENHGCLQSEIR